MYILDCFDEHRHQEIYLCAWVSMNKSACGLRQNQKKCGKGASAASFKDSMLKIAGFNLSIKMWSWCVVKSNVKYIELRSTIRNESLYAGYNEWRRTLFLTKTCVTCGLNKAVSRYENLFAFLGGL